MSEWKAELIDRWNKLRSRLDVESDVFDSSIPIVVAARESDLTWYASRGSEPLSNVLSFTGQDLIKQPTFGRKKSELICDILEGALATGLLPQREAVENAEIRVILPSRADPRIALEEWGVPESFPIDLVALPIRAANYFREEGVHTLGEFLEKWESMDREGFMALKNFGKKTVLDLEAFFKSLVANDRTDAAKWLPIEEQGNSLTLRRAVLSVIDGVKPFKRALLERRLVKMMTLEESATEFGLTRERVRQVEAKFLEKVEDALSNYANEREQMMLAWMNGDDWISCLRPISSTNDELLVTGAMEAIFRDTPYGVARSLVEEQQIESWQQSLLGHPDFIVSGINLDEFLSQNIPPAQHSLFCELLTRWKWAFLDHTSGRVFRNNPKVLDVVLALLEGEDDPIPLTWVVLQVQKTRGNVDVTRERILRMRPKLKAYGPHGPNSKILWHE